MDLGDQKRKIMAWGQLRECHTRDVGARVRIGMSEKIVQASQREREGERKLLPAQASTIIFLIRCYVQRS